MKIHNRQNKTARYLLGLTLLMCAAFVLTPASAKAGTFSGVNGRILFTNITGAAYHFSSLKHDGTDFKDVLVDSVSKYDVEYSPDGKKFAYVEAVSSTPQVFIANADGSNPVQISTSSGIKYTPSWSPDGTKLLYSQAVSSQVHIFRSNIDGTNETEITSTGIYYNPVYSPDATKIIATFDSTDDEIYVMDADGTNVVNLTNNSVEDRKASWSPDGTKIVYSSGVSGFFEIFTMSPTGTNKTQLTSTAVGNVAAVYSPDGTKIAYRDNLAPSLTHIMNADGTGDSTYAFGWVRELTWQPLTIAPQSNNPNPTISLTGGTATVNISSLYTDAYDGIDKASVVVTSTPSRGTTSVNASTGVITYTPSPTAYSTRPKGLAGLLFGVAHAAPTDTFTYRVCSLSNGSLCSTGSVTVSLVGAPVTGMGRPDTMNGLAWILGGISLISIATGAILRSHRTTL